MCLYNCSCHRKADSIAAAFPGPRHIRTVKAVKEAVEITFRQGIAGILHRKFCFFAVFSPENVDFSTLRCVFDGVIHKKGDELVDSCGVAFHAKFLGNVRLQGDLFCDGRGFEGLDGLDDGFGCVPFLQF